MKTKYWRDGTVDHIHPRLFSWGFNLGAEGWTRHAAHFNPSVGVRFLFSKRGGGGGGEEQIRCLLQEISVDHSKEDEWEDDEIRGDLGKLVD